MWEGLSLDNHMYFSGLIMMLRVRGKNYESSRETFYLRAEASLYHLRMQRIMPTVKGKDTCRDKMHPRTGHEGPEGD
jgi:hypothetical protein